jgi:hypothetical protein
MSRKAHSSPVAGLPMTVSADRFGTEAGPNSSSAQWESVAAQSAVMAPLGDFYHAKPPPPKRSRLTAEAQNVLSGMRQARLKGVIEETAAGERELPSTPPVPFEVCPLHPKQ